MKNNSWILFLVSIIIIIILIYLDSIFMTENVYSASTWNVNYSAVIISLFLKICIGLVLGLDQIVRNISKEGKWKINIPKLILMSLPSLFFATLLLIASFGLPIFTVSPLENFFKSGYITILASIFQIVFGYSLVTSFYKIR